MFCLETIRLIRAIRGQIVFALVLHFSQPAEVGGLETVLLGQNRRTKPGHECLLNFFPINR